MAVRRRPARGAPGQHFLRSKRLAADLVREAGIAPGDLVVDIGAGDGALTRALMRAGAEVIALELDPRLVGQLRRLEERGDVTVVQVDATRWAWPARPFRVVSNLPFAGSGAILGHLLRDPTIALRGADVIVQWELAAKVAAVRPATLRSTYWRAWYDLSIAGWLARASFAPVPSVDAAVLRIVRRDRWRVPPGEAQAYRRFLQGAFIRQEPLRRSLRPRLSPLEVKRLAPALGFSPDARAWELDARQWAELYRFNAERTRSRAASRGA